MRLLFGVYVLDPETRQLFRGGEPAHLTPKAYDLLLQLLSARPRVLSKVALQDGLWPDTHGGGSAFCGEAVEDAPSPRPEADRPFVYRLVWDGGIVALAEGEYVLGRHP